MIKYLQRLFRLRIVRYSLVGGVGIPINLAALAVFLLALGDGLYPLALACSFEVSTTINFILNQLFTYHEQKHLHGWGWVKRALKAQMTSLSALAVTYIIALVLKYGAHVNPYLASTTGIVSAFFYNFIISKRFVFRPAVLESSEDVTRSTSFSRTSHALSSTAGYMQNEQDRTLAMQQFKLSGRATEPASLTTTCLSPEVTLSIVVPMMNEQQNVCPLYEKLATQLNQLKKEYELIFVDDGSTDGTFIELQKLHDEHPDIVHVMRFRRNFGKTPALVAAFSRCRGDVVFTMDGDLQDDPMEMPRFLAKLDEGYDLVTGWKYPRLDPLSKTFPSRIFNGLVSRLTRLHLHDINCGFKAYRREVLEDIHLKLYGEFHRFVPVIAHWRGFRVAEIKVRHYPRINGVSKFGGRRFARGLIDLLTILFLTSFLHTPLRLFGKLGFWTFLIGSFIDIFVVVRSFSTHEPIHDQPLLFVGILLMIFGFQFIVIGLLAEMIRHYAFQPGEEYSIRQELAKHNGYDPQNVLVPVTIHTRKGSRPAGGKLFHPQLSHGWEGQQLEPLGVKRNGNKNLERDRKVPHRPTIIPL